MKKTMTVIDSLEELEKQEQRSFAPSSTDGAVVSVVTSRVGQSSPVSLNGQGTSVSLIDKNGLAGLLGKPVEDMSDLLQLFKVAKSPSEIYAYASDVPVPVWLDWFVKLSPKKVEMKGQMDVRAVFANLGPAAKR
jgi:hypothetical protein